MNTVAFKFQLTPEKRQAFQQKTGIELVPRPGARTHTHPLLYAERMLAERYVLSQCNEDDIFDIGGAPHRFIDVNRYHACCPLLGPSDVRRKAYYEGLGRFCEHKYEECFCGEMMANQLATHVLYYLDFESIARKLDHPIGQKRRLFAIIHDFNQASGEFYDEATYELSYNGHVRMAIAGTNDVYTHKSLFDLGQQQYWTNGYQSLAYRLEKSIGHTRVYSFIHAPYHAEWVQPNMPLASMVDDQKHVGRVEDCDHHMEGISIGADLVVQEPGTSVSVTIPKRVIIRAQNICIGIKKDKELMKLVTDRLFRDFKELTPSQLWLASLWGILLKNRLESFTLQKMIEPNLQSLGLLNQNLNWNFDVNLLKYFTGYLFRKGRGVKRDILNYYIQPPQRLEPANHQKRKVVDWLLKSNVRSQPEPDEDAQYFKTINGLMSGLKPGAQPCKDREAPKPKSIMDGYPRRTIFGSVYKNIINRFVRERYRDPNPIYGGNMPKFGQRLHPRSDTSPSAETQSQPEFINQGCVDATDSYQTLSLISRPAPNQLDGRILREVAVQDLLEGQMSSTTVASAPQPRMPIAEAISSAETFSSELYSESQPGARILGSRQESAAQQSTLNQYDHLVGQMSSPRYSFSSPDPLIEQRKAFKQFIEAMQRDQQQIEVNIQRATLAMENLRMETNYKTTPSNLQGTSTSQAAVFDRTTQPLHSDTVTGGYLQSLTPYQPLKPLRETASIKRVPSRGKERSRGPYIAGLCMADYPQIMNSDNPVNEESGLRNRKLQQVDKPTLNFRDVFEQLKPALPYWTHKYEPLPFEKWQQNFPQQRRAEHWEAYKKLGTLTREELDRACVRRTFIKREKLGKCLPWNYGNNDPRVIEGVGAEANVILGPEVAGIQAAIAKKFHHNYHIFYTGGSSSEQLGKWINHWSKRLNYIYENDFSRFDSTLSQPLLRHVEHQFMDHMGLRQNNPQAWDVLTRQLHTKGYTTHGYKYQVEGTRKSGDPNTTLGNTIINIALHYHMAKVLKLGKVAIMAMGDDMVMMTENQMDLKQCEEYFKSAGLVSTTIHRKTLYDVTFCSGRFWPTKDGIVFGQDIGRFLSRTGWSEKPVADQDLLQHVHGVMIGHRDSTNHIPILRDYVQDRLTKLHGVKVGKTQRDYRFRTEKSHEMSDQGWDMLFHLYDLTPRDAKDFNNWIRTQPIIGFAEHPIASKAMRVAYS